MSKGKVKAGNLGRGDYVIVNEEPCIVNKKSDTSAGNKGNAKEKIYVEGLFDGQKRTFVESPDSEVEVPSIERKVAQILAIIGNSAQLMDLSCYETFELSIPLDLRGEISEGDEVEYVQALGRKKIERKRG